MTQQPSNYNPNEHLIQIKTSQGSKDYLPVQQRIVWFRSIFPQGTIDTEELEFDHDRECEAEVYVWNNEKRRSEKTIKRAKGYARYKAIVTDGLGGRATGTKSENAANFADFCEKAETGAIGRALANLGYGTQFAPEMDEEHRIVDAPVERTPTVAGGNRNQAAAPADSDAASQQQLASIRKLCEHVGKAEPEGLASMSYLDAKKLIAQLTAEYKEHKENSKTASPQPEDQQAQPTALYLTPEEVADLKKRWADICHIKSEAIEQRWKSFKAYIHPPLAGERVMSDDHIPTKDRAKMEKYLADQQKPATAEK